MKLTSTASTAPDITPYAKRHPLLLRWITLIMIGSIMIIPIAFMVIVSPLVSQNRMHSRIFYLSPQLHDSKPKTKTLNLREYNVDLAEPIDNRVSFDGEYFRKGSTIESATPTDFFKRPAMQEIQKKIESDMIRFGANQHEGKNNLAIKTTVDVFYPDVKGFAWLRSFAKVRLDMTARLNDSTIITKKYESFYSTFGLDREYEGSLVTTIEQGANVTLGMTLRKSLDRFYADLANILPTSDIAAKAKRFKNVLFKTGSADVPVESETDLSAVVDFMKSDPELKIELDGYTDNVGDFIKDKELSRDRVKAVKSYLVRDGIRPHRIKTKAYGATRPISTNNNEESHRLNRRVEFVIIKS